MPPHPTAHPPLSQSHQPLWLRFGIGDCAVFLERYFSCISDTLKGEEDKGGVGEKTPSRCVSPREGLEPCHSRLSLHQLSLIAREDRIPRAQLFLILFGASEAWKAKRPAFDLFFLLVFFFFPVVSYYLFPQSETLHSHCAPVFIHAKIIIKLCFIK